MTMMMDAMLLYDTSPVEDDEPKRRFDAQATTDDRLVDLANRGDFGAFEELVRRYRNDVFALSYHYVRNREEAWDISQEVFVKAFQALRRFRGDASFKTWLLRITANRCKDFFKKRRLTTVALDGTNASRAAADPVYGPDRNVEIDELGQAIQEAIAGLPDKHRTAFILREYEGLSYEKMAEVMHCSPGTVMSRLHHARKKLQKALLSKGVVENY